MLLTESLTQVLFSITTLRRPRRACSSGVLALTAGAAPRVSVMPKSKVVPWPGSERREIRPPICSIRWLVMISPRPVPPYRRDMEESAWVNGLNSVFCFSGSMPMPVS